MYFYSPDAVYESSWNTGGLSLVSTTFTMIVALSVRGGAPPSVARTLKEN